MAVRITAQKGTQDVMPNESYRWQFVENLMKETAKNYGYREARTPTFEATELFSRSAGDTSDVVQKEMYTFTDKGDRSITLKPEGTAGILRAAIESGQINDALPYKACYVTPCFRYDKPQAGRFREFHQFGIECLGAPGAGCDVEAIALANEIFSRLGLTDCKLFINSIGCKTCRAKYTQALQEYFSQYKDALCETCLDRLEKNPMRILDCKSPVCKNIAKDAPKILDFICEDCSAHFESVKRRLEAIGIPYEIDTGIVRGLDYYSKTVFEFVSEGLGLTVCGGGRYDGLCEELSGPKVTGLGFGMGIERLLLVLEKAGIELPGQPECDAYICSIGEAASCKAQELVQRMREAGLWAECDIVGRSVKAQMKYANKIGARFSMVLGDDELANGAAQVKEMATGKSEPVSFDKLSDYISTASIAAKLGL